MTHQVWLNVTPNTYAITVVVGMAAAGLMLGTILDRLLIMLGIDTAGGRD